MDKTHIFAALLVFDQSVASMAGRVCDLAFSFESKEVFHSGARGQIPFGWFNSFGSRVTLIP